MSFTPAQCRAARALLGWSQGQLAEASGVATKTIADFEREDRSPYERTLNDIHEALARAGVEFTNGGQPGVKMKPWQHGDRVRLRGPSEWHATTFGIAPKEVAVVEEWEIFPGQAPSGHFRLRLASGDVLRGIPASHFERATQMNEGGLRPTKSADELRVIVSERLRRHPECSTIQHITVIPEERSSSHGQNWKAAFVVDGAGSAPAKAFAIAREVGMEFDLAT
jgi:transcriptional regulator with XRE-family HTH domain